MHSRSILVLWAGIAIASGLTLACGGGGSSKSAPAATATPAAPAAVATVAANLPSAITTSLPSAAATVVSGLLPNITGGAPGAAATLAAGLLSDVAGAAATVKIGDSSRGKVLTDAKGMTLYTSNRDVAGNGKSGVSGSVLAAWPALTINNGSPVKPAGLSGDLGLITRDDGSKQVTYKGLPLYLWQSDKAPGDVTGQGVGGFSLATP